MLQASANFSACSCAVAKLPGFTVQRFNDSTIQRLFVCRTPPRKARLSLLPASNQSSYLGPMNMKAAASRANRFLAALVPMTGLQAAVRVQGPAVLAADAGKAAKP